MNPKTLQLIRLVYSMALTELQALQLVRDYPETMQDLGIHVENVQEEIRKLVEGAKNGN